MVDQSLAHQALKSPRGCPHVPWEVRVVVWPGHSVFLSGSLSDWRKKIPDSKYVRWFSLATAVGLLCDEYWTGCVDGRHIISSHDEQRPRTNSALTTQVIKTAKRAASVVVCVS